MRPGIDANAEVADFFARWQYATADQIVCSLLLALIITVLLLVAFT